MKTVRVAITGLKRSGKSVFITSLVNQLLNRKDDSMSDFPTKNKNGYFYAEILPLPKKLNRFPYEDNLQALKKDPPEWPKPTETLSEIHLKFLYRKSKSGSSKSGSSKTIRLEIVDYPGEWLPDLQMLNLPFHEWSRKMLTLAREEYRSSYAQKWLRLLEKIDISAPITEHTTYLVDAYVEYLLACDDAQIGLIDLQPGHFLNTRFKLSKQFFRASENGSIPSSIIAQLKPLEEQHFPSAEEFLSAVKEQLDPEDVMKFKRMIMKYATSLDFCPLPLPSSFQEAPWHSRHKDQRLFTVFERRYNLFRQKQLYPFYTKCFHRANVQIVLLDVLKILNQGMHAHNEHRNCIEGILRSFDYGYLGKCLRPLRPLSKHLPTFLPLEKIEKTIFVATKADHAAPIYHENLTGLVADIVSQAQNAAKGPKTNARIIKTFISSIRSTEAAEIEIDGKMETRLQGTILKDEAQDIKDEQRFGYWRTREVPPKFPSNEEEWIPSHYRSYSFQPIKFPSKEGTPVPHINLDQLLGHILQDYL